MLYLFAEANTEAIQEQITRWDSLIGVILLFQRKKCIKSPC